MPSVKDAGPSPQERGSGSTSAVRPESMRRAETPDKLPPEDPEETTAKKKIVLDLRRTKSTENLHPKEHRYYEYTNKIKLHNQIHIML